MLMKIKMEQEINVLALKAKMGVRYWEDATVNGKECETSKDMPLSDGDYWSITIDIDTGKILGWPKGVTASVHFKVCDSGEYNLYKDNGDCLCGYHGYVPECLSPGGDSWCDYVIMKIDENGKIEGWSFDPYLFMTECEEN